MKIVITNNSSVPIYQQIKNAIIDDIAKGNLEAEEQLPSIRELSSELKISILTAKKAYDELEKEGFIYVRQGLGSFVSSIGSEFRKEELQKQIEIRLKEAVKIAIKAEIGKEELKELLDYLYTGEAQTW